jgi:hypothetical protein
LASNSGGGVSGASVTNSTLIHNSAYQDGGGAGGGHLVNCLLTDNSASHRGGGAFQGTLKNCTIADNSAAWGGGDSWSTLDSCIVWYNSATESERQNLYYTTANRVCSPDASDGSNGCITNAPKFVDRSNGDFSLQVGSPCIDAGNNTGVTEAVDLNGAPRIQNAHVDMGAYEFQPIPSDMDGDIMADAWESIYFGHPSNCVASVDGDQDAMDNLAEYIAGSDPTNGGSFFSITNTSMGAGGFTVYWNPAISNRAYSVFWRPKLSDNFQPLENNLIDAQSSYTDSTHTTNSVGFYKIEVELRE